MASGRSRTNSSIGTIADSAAILCALKKRVSSPPEQPRFFLRAVCACGAAERRDRGLISAPLRSKEDRLPHFAVSLSSRSLFPAQNQTSGVGLRDQFSVFIEHIALGVANRATAMYHASFRTQKSLPHGPQEIDLQLQRRKRFASPKRARKRDAHRSIRNVTQNPAMHRTHGIRMLRPCLQSHHRSPSSGFWHLESNQSRRGRSRVPDVFT